MRKHKKVFFWLIVIALFIIGIVYISQRNKHASDTKMYFSYNMQGDRNLGKLGIQSPEINAQTMLTGTLCVANPEDVSKIDLYMPDMGHGSAPPLVSKSNLIPKSLRKEFKTKEDYGCFKLSKMEMFMPGLWQVRVFYQNGENGYFEINLDK